MGEVTDKTVYYKVVSCTDDGLYSAIINTHLHKFHKNDCGQLILLNVEYNVGQWV